VNPSRQTPDELLQAIDATRVDVDPAVRALSARFQPGFELLSAGIVRRQSATEALKRPDGFALYEHKDRRVVICTRRMPGWTLLVLADVMPDALYPRCAYRLAGTDDAAQLADDPTRALSWFLERFGVRYAATPGRLVWFVPIVVVPRAVATVEEAIDLLAFEDATENVQLVALARTELRPPRTTYVWPFGLLKGSYRKAARSGRR
jgi:hypothetical protein